MWMCRRFDQEVVCDYLLNRNLKFNLSPDDAFFSSKISFAIRDAIYPTLVLTS